MKHLLIFAWLLFFSGCTTPTENIDSEHGLVTHVAPADFQPENKDGVDLWRNYKPNRPHTVMHEYEGEFIDDPNCVDQQCQPIFIFNFNEALSIAKDRNYGFIYITSKVTAINPLVQNPTYTEISIAKMGNYN